MGAIHTGANSKDVWIDYVKAMPPQLSSDASRVLWLLSLVTVAILLGACTPAQAERDRTPLPTRAPTRTAISVPTATAAPTHTPEAVCSVRDLGANLHIAAGGSYTETQTQAAGAMICRISRDSCAFWHLIGIREPSIVFKREEPAPYAQEDSLIHPAMLEPLLRLNELVQQEWDGDVQLRVTDAYDSRLEHHLWESDESKRVSLHFEGRAIDLTTYPIDPTKYGRLCALAHCAGFDWVHNEVTHCHAAIRAPSLCLRC